MALFRVFPSAQRVLPELVSISSRALFSTSTGRTIEASANSSTPSYTITEAPNVQQESGKQKWGRYVMRGIKGHTKKLNPIARQVSCSQRIPCNKPS